MPKLAAPPSKPPPIHPGPGSKGSKKKTSKKAATKSTKSGKPPATPAKPKEVDTSKIATEKARKRLDAIYKREKKVEAKRAIFDLASQNRRAAKANLEAAEEALEKEIREQRFGPGPLFGPDGGK